MRGWAGGSAARREAGRAVSPLDEGQGRQLRCGMKGKAGGAMEAAVQKQQARDALPDLLG